MRFRGKLVDIGCIQHFTSKLDILYIMNIETYYFDYSRQELCTVSQQVVVVATAANSQGQRFNAQILGVSRAVQAPKIILYIWDPPYLCWPAGHITI